MILTLDNTISYLLRKKLINRKSIVQGDLRILDVSRKNRNIEVISRNGKSDLIKQAKLGDMFSAKTIKREFQLYQLIESDFRLSELRSVIPTVVDFDTEQNILIIELYF